MVSSPTIPPGGEGKIEVKLSTAGRRGRLAKTVHVYSNDPKQKRFELKIQGEIEMMLGFEPQRLYVRMKKGKVEKKIVRIVGKRAAGVKLSELKSNKPERVTVKLVEADGKPQLEITVKAGTKEGRISARVTARTNIKEHASLSLFVWAEVSADIVAVPRRVFMRRPQAGKPSSRWISLYSHDKKPFTIKRVVDPSGAVVATAKKESPHRWRVELRLKKAPGARGGKLKIHTSRRDQRVIEVSYQLQRDFKMRSIPAKKVGKARGG